MEVIGPGAFTTFTPQDKGWHKPGPQELWQESMAQVWWDPKNNIGGFYRLGHETNRKTGPMAAWWGTTYSPTDVWKHDSYLPLRPQDRTVARPFHYGAGDDLNSYSYENGKQIWASRADDFELELEIHDFHDEIDCYPKVSTIADVNPLHIEVAGTCRGKLRMKGQTFDIDGHSYRDKGWGERKWHTYVTHRWIVGTFGPDLSLCCLNWHSSSNQFANFGWICRDNKIIFAKKLDFLSFMEADGISTRGGVLTIELTTGEVLKFEYEGLAPSAISYIHNLYCVDTLSRIHHNGRIGYGAWETNDNCQHGQNRPMMAINGVLDNGWHPRARKEVMALISGS